MAKMGRKACQPGRHGVYMADSSFGAAEKRGVRVAKVIEQLLVLQAADQDIRQMRKEMDDIPLRKAQIESRLGAHQEGLAQAEHQLLEAKSAVKHLEAEIETARGQIQKYRDQQLQIKSNDGYKALEKEIATTQSNIRKLEDRELEAMEAVELAKAEVQVRQDSLGKEQVRVDEEVKTFLGRSEDIGRELAAKEEERKALAADIDPAWVSRYERIFAKQHDAAIALVEHGTCGCCHMKLAPSQVVDARKADTLTSCAFCGRMLYMAP